jgi:lipopolysaccharide export system protein LptA
MTVVRHVAIRYVRSACAICAVALAGLAIAHAQGAPKAPTTTASTTTSNAPPNALQGFSQNRDKPIQIDAARLEVRDKDKVATFFGDAKADVKVIQGDTTMRSRKLVVFYEQDEAAKGGKAVKAASPGPGGSSQIRRLEAIGNVIVTQKDQTVTGETGIFEMKTNTITMSGSVVMTQAENVVQGDRLVVDMGTGVSRVETAPGGRVKALLKGNPKDSGASPDASKQGKSGPLGIMPGR